MDLMDGMRVCDFALDETKGTFSFYGGGEIVARDPHFNTPRAGGRGMIWVLGEDTSTKYDVTFTMCKVS
jgi:hypothetical protein